MKFFLASLALNVCLFAFVNALDVPPPIIYRRAVAMEPCPQDVNCNNYAQEAYGKLSVCASYEVQRFDIKWNTCGIISCLRGTKLGKEDLSKRFPDCCAQCA